MVPRLGTTPGNPLSSTLFASVFSVMEDMLLALLGGTRAVLEVELEGDSIFSVAAGASAPMCH